MKLNAKSVKFEKVKTNLRNGGFMFIPVSANLIRLAKIFPTDLFVVGGYVRNSIMGIKGGDIDLASDVDVDEITDILKANGYKVKVKNSMYNSITIQKGAESYEFTSFRKDYYGENGKHCPVRVERTSNIAEDAKRRDFTINAIYYNIAKDEIVDFYQGVVDAKERILRCIGSPEEVLKNDGERILRMVRLVGELNLKIEKKTLKSAFLMGKNIADLSPSRRYGELEKIVYCDMRYKEIKGDNTNALKLLNKLSVWQYFGLPIKKVKYKMVKRADDRMLGLLIDIVDTVKPECLETFLVEFLKNCGFSQGKAQKIFVYIAGYYSALEKMKNKEYFFRYFDDVNVIFPLLSKKSKHLTSKYMFFYKYIIRYGLTIRTSDLKVDREDIAKNFPKIDERSYDRILNDLLSKVFDGKLPNEREALLAEIDNWNF